MAKVPSIELFRQLQRTVADQAVKIRRLEARQYPKKPLLGGGGGKSVRGVCTACSYDSVTRNLIITASRLLSAPNYYEVTPADDNDVFTALCCPDAWIRTGVHVLLTPIVAPPADPSITWSATPLYACDRTMLNPPAQECLTEFVEPCGPDAVPNLCG